MTLAEGWAVTTLADCQGKTTSIDPRCSPKTEFDLFSVPAHVNYRADRLFGDAIGSIKQQVQPGDVLLCKIVPHIRRGWVVPDKEQRQQIASGEWIVFRDNALVPEFLRWFVLSDGFHSQFMRTVSGVGGSLMRARPAEAGKICVPVPPLAEQRRIVAKLDALTARLARARAELERVLRLAKMHKERAINAMFRTKFISGQICPSDNAIDHRHLPLHAIPNGWSWKAVGTIASVSGGLTKNAARREMPMQVPYLRVANVYMDELRLDDVALIGCSEKELAKTILRWGDLLVVEGNGSLEQVGRTAIWRNEFSRCSHQNHLIRVRVSQEIDPEFVLLWLSSSDGRQCVERLAASTSGLHTLSIAKVAGLPVPVPSLDEQRHRVRSARTALAQVDRVIVEATRAHALLDRLEPALLAKAFRGELVPQDPDDEPASVLLDRIRAQRAAAPVKRKPRAKRQA